MTTPPGSPNRIRQMIPPTPAPGKKQRVHLENTPPFKSPLSMTFEGSKNGVDYYLDINNCYVLKQPPTKGPCGLACALMIYLDKNHGEFPADKEFWTKYQQNSFLNGDDLVSLFRDLKIQATHTIFSGIGGGDKVLTDISFHNKPVIMAITHPKLEGHWIIIDKVTSERVTLRDPYSGKSYEEDRKVIAGMILNDVQNEHSVFIQ